ncbi:hypothetical protein BWI97_18315 [Siphonobacter sp. BAB-5405]|uniref:hypothetical protein n=1 Tax=Siphonobacter sp. BAB-5405 TaxID=1864825 RepID=UPI000C8090E7|nr:hypothetical protein [Siphonobacter sp. BAB-5405]PMD93547.1 hypothetical protein BWI97_18315 [Siphonobacter sp. BAB-5405]
MTQLSVELEYQIGQPVWLKTDPEQHERMITAIILIPKNIMYRVAMAGEESEHYGFEIFTDQKKSSIEN